MALDRPDDDFEAGDARPDQHLPRGGADGSGPERRWCGAAAARRAAAHAAARTAAARQQPELGKWSRGPAKSITRRCARLTAGLLTTAR